MADGGATTLVRHACKAVSACLSWHLGRSIRLGTACRTRLFGSLLSLVWTAQAGAAMPAIPTPFGTVSVGPSFQLLFNGEPLANPHSEETFLPHESFARVAGNWNAILLSGNEIPNCLQFQWLLLSQSGAHWSPVFGTCDTKIQVSVSGDELTLAMRTQIEGKRRKPVTFVLKGSGFGQRERIPEWPQGYIKWRE